MKTAAHISLTEAMTEIAEGDGQNAEAYIASRLAKEEGRQSLFIESARARAIALQKAGFDPEIEPNPLLVGRLPEITSHRKLATAHAIERDEEIMRLWQAAREIIAAGAGEYLKIIGRPKGEGKLENIEAAELLYLSFNEQTGFDTLYNRDTELFWTQVTLEKAQFADWKLRTQGAVADPSIASEKRALIHLAHCLKANEQLTKAEGAKALQDAKIPLSDAGFKRIWPKAREEAGLPEKGRPGPRKRSNS